MPNQSLSELLGRHRVFSLLDAASKARLARRLTCRTFEAGERVAAGAALGRRLGWVLRGQVALLREGHDVAIATLEPGELFGAGALPRGDPDGWTVMARERADIAFLPAADVAHLCAEHPAMALFLSPPPATGGDGAGERASDAHLGLMAQPVRSLLKRAPVALAPDASILQAARTMRDERVSSVLLLQQDRLFGVVTDRDLRNRVLAAGLDPQQPLHRIATVAPLTVDAAQPAFEALLLMARHNIHHVPVLDGQRVAGMLSASDLAEQHSTSAVYLAGEVHKQTSLQGLVEVAARVPQLQRNLAAAQASACSTGHMVTAITDAVTTRLLQMAQAQLGPAPVDYAWVAAGSQARSEQTARSDQDNCLVFDDRYDEARHGRYFRELAGFVNDGLHACGYVYCPGEMMARTDAWRQPQRRWAEYFQRWTEEPEPKALMLTCVFFDLRAIHGRAELLGALRAQVLRRTRDNRIFLAYMVGNALKHRPPLSLFGGISTVRAGKVRDAVDLKHSGIVPIVDLARIYALAGGHEAVNTYARLEVAAQGGEISAQSARDLRDALEFMAGLRIRHQAQQTRLGQAPDNFLSLSELSNFERSQLKDAFGVVQTLQSVLAQRYR
ncbi:putative nucleotidyltransferase substrate binding domain-containing protein [uncultured Azohydromonas sp.]|uniref:putative nucleotidyltransferase substrate binding domain-containing protein n=1 Tax=uncultured Azohydromonas sp. TaxID=487342 RepID=UPI00262410EA|nr:putative nucleotidyltransferase substrate binding domain-containing protein [uncultured Azohydromonas sp.]